MTVEDIRTLEARGSANGAALDLDAARRLLADPPNVLAANHLHQTAEKILGAVRLHRGLLNTKDHDLVILIDGRPEGEPRPLPADDPWRGRFRPLEPLSAYATTFRYSRSVLRSLSCDADCQKRLRGRQPGTANERSGSHVASTRRC